MASQELYDLMGTQLAIRRLKPDPIPDDVLKRILQAAAYAPTGGNRQPWRMIVVKDAEKKKALGALYAEHWKGFSGNYRKSFESLPEEKRAREDRTIDAGDYLAEHFGEIPVVVVVCFDPKQMAITDARLERPSVVGGGSVYPSVQNLMLAARNENVGCVLTTLLCMVEPQVKEILGIPDDWYTCAHIPMGYAVGKGYGPTRRKPLEDLFFEDHWDNQLS